MKHLLREKTFSRAWLFCFVAIIGWTSLVPAGSIQDLEIYLLPHSHVDIGYTNLQTEIEKDHWRFYEQWIEKAQQTRNYPPEAQFKGNVEVLWAVDSYLKQASPEKRKIFIEAVKQGWIGLEGLYGNELTALCRPEELTKLLDYSNQLKREYGVIIDAAMLTDVPGCTWGVVPVLAQNGIKYLSLGPNSEHRIGHVRTAWDGKPFYWVSPCGRYKILCWQTTNSYHPAFRNEKELVKFIEKFPQDYSHYPYDIIYFRQSLGDNAPLPMNLPEFVKDWNSKHKYPKLIIATTGELFREFERRYGDRIPSFTGDFTGYWEDGAISSARETAINRASAERLVQADTLWAMLRKDDYPIEAFSTAWRNVLLYDEHTWGARSYVHSGMHCWPPGTKEYDAQWKIKQAFALDADSQSRRLLDQALTRQPQTAKKASSVDVINTSSWPRTDLVILPEDLKIAGDLVKDTRGKTAPSQRLSNGELAFLAKDIPPFAAKRFNFKVGKISAKGKVQARKFQLSNQTIAVTVDENTGAISSLKWKQLPVELVNAKSRMGLNDYFYVNGLDPKDAQRNGKVKVRVKENGPLVASLLIESEAPGCHKLNRELRLIEGINRLDIINVVDKEEIPVAQLRQKPNPRKEGVYFGFAFNVPQGVIRMDIPWAVARPSADQLPGSCKNFFTVQRWVDVSNQDYGITWATVDAPLITLGEIPLQPHDPYKQFTPDGRLIWKKHLGTTQNLYSYIMNNYWTTNYRHSQGGLTTFRYSLRPHQLFDGGQATRFGHECSQPLIVIPAEGRSAIRKSLLRVDPLGVIVTALKPSIDGKALILRLFNVSGRPEIPKLTWADSASRSLVLSNLAEEELTPISKPPPMAPYEFVTLRIDKPPAK